MTFSPTPTHDIAPQAVLEVCLCHAVRRTARAIARVYDAALRPVGLTSGQFTILAALGGPTPLSTPRLGDILAMDRTTLSRTLKPLKKAGLVDHAAGAGRRSGRLILTDSGHHVLREAAPLWRQAQTTLSGRVGGARAGQALSLLGALADVAQE